MYFVWGLIVIYSRRSNEVENVEIAAFMLLEEPRHDTETAPRRHRDAFHKASHMNNKRKKGMSEIIYMLIGWWVQWAM